MPSPFSDFAMPADATARFYPVNPSTRRRIFPAEGDGEACWIEMRGWHSSAGTKHRHAREEKLRRLARDLTPEENERDATDLLAALTVSWHLVAPTGRVLEADCNFDSARGLFGDADMLWLKGQALGFVNSEGNFLPESWISSAPSRATSSG